MKKIRQNLPPYFFVLKNLLKFYKKSLKFSENL